MDEAGRGALAGPVVAAAVVLPPGCVIRGVRDSKQLTPRVRLQLAREIKRRALSYAIACVGAHKVDELNIRRASFAAMRKAIARLRVLPDLVLVDGFAIPELSLAQRGVIRGDQTVHVISAASILAKVSRDRMMENFGRRYPSYEFARHKGYPTALHRAALERFGPCPIHRQSYAPVREVAHGLSRASSPG